jgi:hypothetical protein
VSVFAGVVGILSFWGWIFDSVLLISVILVAPNDAEHGHWLHACRACLMVWSASVAGTRLVTLVPTVANVCAGLVASVGLVTLVEYVAGVDLGIDTLLFRGRLLADQQTHPGRMAPATALCFSLLGSALLFLDARTRHGRWPAQSLAAIVILTGATTLFGYLFGLRAFYQFSSYYAMALPPPSSSLGWV